MKQNAEYNDLQGEVNRFYKKSEEALESILFRLKKHHNAVTVSKNVDEQQKILLNTLDLLQQGIDMDLVNVVKVVMELKNKA